MQNKFEVRYLPISQKDLISILDWIALDSPTRAFSFVGSLDKKIGNLATHPLMGRVPRNEKLRDMGYHILVVEDFLVFYVVRGKLVEIHRVLHGSRHYADIL